MNAAPSAPADPPVPGRTVRSSLPVRPATVTAPRSLQLRGFLAATSVPARIAVILVWVACLPRMVPTLVLDRGIFVSVAERLLAGDVLYRDVWDNKDPLFYYAVALGRAFTPYGDIVLEAFWVVLAALAMTRLARWIGCSPSWALVTGFVMTPLVLTGGIYLPGYSHLPGVAVSLVALAALAGRRYGVVGGLVGVLLFLKLVMVPVLLLPFALTVVLRRDYRRLPAAALGFVIVGVVIVVALQLRGELVPYVQSLILNVSYSQASLIDTRWGPIVGHLLRVFQVDALVAVIAIVTILVWRARSSIRERAAERDDLVMWAWTLSALVAAIGVLAVTGLWPQHNQILLVPALLAALAFVSREQRSFSLDAAKRSAAVVLVVAACVAGLLSGPAPIGYVKSFVDAPALAADLTAVPPEAQALLAERSEGTYARVGQNDDLGGAYGLSSWKLMCSHFDQYPFDPPQTLSAVVRCLPTAQYVVVSASATPEPGKTTWNRYLQQVDAVLQDRYTCHPSGKIQVCERDAAG